MCGILASSALGQDHYQINIFGFPCVDVTMDTDSPGTIDFTTRTVGLVDIIWPVDNTYSTKYDPATFVVVDYERKIKQGSHKQTVSFTRQMETNLLEYGNDEAVERPADVQTVFTMLARVVYQEKDLFDTRWFPLEHEGRQYNTRLLWAGEVDEPIGGRDITCDFYRLDMVPVEKADVAIIDGSDYFSEHIIHPDAVRQIWVTDGDRKKIVKAAVKIYGISVVAELIDE